MLILNFICFDNYKVFLSVIVLYNRMSAENPAEKAEDEPLKIDEENPEIIIKVKEDTEETSSHEGEEDSGDTAKREAADKEPIKCPICGTKNMPGSTECALCKTLLSRSKSGKLKVKSPKLPGDILMMIDIEDPVTRKKLEELAMIPGVSRVKALYLFQSGIASIEEFIEKAFHGERLSKNFSRTVTNKLLMASIKAGKGEEEDAKLICPSCDAPNEPDVTECKVCGFEIEKDMETIDMDDVSDKLSGTVDEVFGELMESDDFTSLPDSLKAQMAVILDSDDFEDIGEVTAEMELFDLGEGEEAVGHEVTEPVGQEVETDEPAPEPTHEEPEPKEFGPVPEEEPEPAEEETYSFETAADQPESPEPVVEDEEEATEEEPVSEPEPEVVEEPEKPEPEPEPEPEVAEEPEPESTARISLESL